MIALKVAALVALALVLALGLLMIAGAVLIIAMSYLPTRWRVLARALAVAAAPLAWRVASAGTVMGILRCVLGEWVTGLGDFGVAGLWLWVWLLGGGGGRIRKKAARLAGRVKQTVAGRLTVVPAPSPS